MTDNKIDIYENDIPNAILEILLKDHTTQKNIFWATNDYEHLGKGYEYHSSITPELITKKNGYIIMPRTLKNKRLQQSRSKDMAEVFTPAWVCNAQNNLVDEAWFGRKNVFNEEVTNENGKHFWISNSNKITFPENKTWKNYVNSNRLEITCGEAPYLVSRYDATTGEAIPIENRIGILDRKLRVVNENTETSGEWLEAAQEAYKSTYGYEWQGDNLLLAREALLYTFIDYYQQKFGKEPLEKSCEYIAYIISWNLWQMDGLKGVVPNSCKTKITVDLFDEEKTACSGCKTEGFKSHNGIYCMIKDWRAKKERQKIRFVDLIKK